MVLEASTSRHILIRYLQLPFSSYHILWNPKSCTIMPTIKRKHYEAPVLYRYGTIRELTGQFPCYQDKTIGFPSDTNWAFIPITDCPTSGLS